MRIETTKKGQHMKTKLWAMLIPGPDDVWAMPSKESAEETAEKHNKAIKDSGFAEEIGMPFDAIAARVIEWPYGADEHAEAMADDEPATFDSYGTETHNAGGNAT